MNTRKSILLAIAFLFVAAFVMVTPAQDKKMHGDKMKNEMMSEMEKSPHHKMMMAYRQNIANFADALSEMTKDEKTFDAEFARAALAEIKRGAEMTGEIHRKHSAMMPAEMKDKMKPMMEKMLSVERAAISASTTPISDKGSDIMIATGWMKLANCEARIR